MAGPRKPKSAKRDGEGQANAASRSPQSAEALLGRLDEVVRELESGELPLEQALTRFEEGIKLVRDGEQLLASVEQRIEMLLASGEVVDFADDDDYADDEPADEQEDR